MAKEIHHTANHIISTFILSNRSLKKIYGLTPILIALLRYICDSIDLNFKKRKSLSTKIYQTQLARHCHIACPKALRRNLLYLHKKRLIKYCSKKHHFSLGKALLAWGFKPYPIEGGFKTPLDRSRVLNPPSKSSNFTNKRRTPKEDQNPTPTAPVTSQSTSFGVIPETPEEAALKYEEQMAYFKIRTVQ